MTLRRADTPSKRVALYSMFLASALIISYVESLLPPLLPGMKPGLANIAVMCAMCVSVYGAAGVSIARVIICGILFGNTVSFLMSLSGAVLSFAVLLCIKLLKVKGFSFVGISVLSAVGHNSGQLICAAVLAGSGAAFLYAPVLALSSVVCGAFSGILMNLISPFIKKQITSDYNT